MSCSSLSRCGECHLGSEPFLFEASLCDALCGESLLLGLQTFRSESGFFCSDPLAREASLLRFGSGTLLGDACLLALGLFGTLCSEPLFFRLGAFCC